MIKGLKETKFVEPAIHPAVVGAGNDGDGHLSLLAEAYGFADTGHGIELIDFLTDPFVTGDTNSFPVEGFSGEFLEHILG